MEFSVKLDRDNFFNQPCDSIKDTSSRREQTSRVFMLECEFYAPISNEALRMWGVNEKITKKQKKLSLIRRFLKFFHSSYGCSQITPRADRKLVSGNRAQNKIDFSKKTPGIKSKACDLHKENGLDVSNEKRKSYEPWSLKSKKVLKAFLPNKKKARRDR